MLLDVADSSCTQIAVQTISDQYGTLDRLINNAGIALDNYEKPSTWQIATIRKDFDVNFFGLNMATQALIPLLRLSKSAKVINISSAVGSLTRASDPYQNSAMGYQTSKTAVNMFTGDLANELKTSITVNAVNPDWVATMFAGGGGDKTIAEGVARTMELTSREENDINGTLALPLF